jgi:hypothetical protein
MIPNDYPKNLEGAININDNALAQILTIDETCDNVLYHTLPEQATRLWSEVAFHTHLRQECNNPFTTPTDEQEKELWRARCYLWSMLMRSEELPDIALEFARLCMGWDDAELKLNQPDDFLFRARENEKSPDVKWFFCFTYFSHVIEVVVDWCTDHHASMTLSWIEGKYADIRVPELGIVASSGNQESGCVALLSACVEAARSISSR